MNDRRLINSFGRRIGKRLSKESQSLIEEILPNYLVNPENLSQPDQELYLEIGFGNGDFIIEFAINNPNTLCIGCEPYLNGVSNVLKKIKSASINNIRLWPDDARLLLTQLPDKIFSMVYILFPDPWPKKKQYKRRLINENFLNLLSSKLKPKAIINIATDHVEYAKWILATCLNQNNLKWVAESQADWMTPFNYVTLTRYYQKAASKTLEPYFFKFVNI
jgi:tRNA (guanine-N7-)-methyltransferase